LLPAFVVMLDRYRIKGRARREPEERLPETEPARPPYKVDYGIKSKH
jgi:hypothetical protein